MFYTIYKITNKINNKIYIGMHKTEDLDDGYMGSGKLIRRAISKHGLDNFTKEILFVFDNEQDMKAKEAELVEVSEETYNLCDGGHGGFGYINRTIDITKRNRKISNKRNYDDPKYRKTLSLAIKQTIPTRKKAVYSEEGLIKKQTSFLGKHHSEETKQRIAEANSRMIGKKNSQFGTMWITNGSENRKIKKTDPLPEGWNRGRI